MTKLFQRSIDIILQNQSPSGAYVASPNFETYHYSWFRDGSFIAYAMNVAGKHESAARFHHWASTVINQRKATIERAITKAGRNEPLDSSDLLDTRYTAEGLAGEEEWPNFQLDGLGTWLWAMERHKQLSGEPLPAEMVKAAGLVAGYLAALWQHPCSDCWEEFPDQVHMYTLGSAYAGLNAYASISGQDQESVLSEIKHFICDKGVGQGHFVKYVGSDLVDASLIGLATPYLVVSPNSPIMQATVTKIENTILQSGGLHRYIADTYYGGGIWVLLTAWLGWYYAQVGAVDKAVSVKTWVEAQADAEGNLPKQIPVSLNDTSFYEPWVQRWGEIASPLLWSHAQYIILSWALDQHK